MKIILIVVVIVFVILMIAGYYFFKFACVVDRNNPQQDDTAHGPWKKYATEHQKNIDFIHSLNKEDCWITSFDGLKLHAYYIPTNNPKRMIVCAHGYKGKGEEDFSKAVVHLHEDTDILLIDERCCGLSEGTIITFGAKEKKDIIQWVEYLNKEKNTNHLPIYLYGMSLGSASVCMTSSHHFDSEVKGIIADCGYSSFKDIALQLAKSWFHIPGWPIIPFLDFYCRVLGHFSLKEADASKALSQSTLPVLFFHGNDDTFVIPSNTQKNYESCSTQKEVTYIDGATHVTSIYTDEKTYFSKLNDFFVKYDQ